MYILLRAELLLRTTITSEVNRFSTNNKRDFEGNGVLYGK